MWITLFGNKNTTVVSLFPCVIIKNIIMNQSFAVQMNLRPADVVVVPITKFNVTAHFAVYRGIDVNGIHWYLENNHVYGVRWIDEGSFIANNPTYKRIQCFQGNDYARTQAINRATSLLGRKYEWHNFNCEHYANFVQFGYYHSKQVNNVDGIVAGAALGLVAIALVGIFSGK